MESRVVALEAQFETEQRLQERIGRARLLYVSYASLTLSVINLVLEVVWRFRGS